MCDRHGSLLITDEMITGFRWSEHGAQAVYDIRPDLSCWGKGDGQRLPVVRFSGQAGVLELGGLRTDRERVFLLSTTHGPETGSLAAFRAVVKAYANDDPIGRMEHAGRLLVDGVEAAVRDEGFADYVQLKGRASCLTFTTKDAEKNPSQAYRTLFLQELLQRGLLCQSFVTSAAHTDRDIEQTVAAVRGALTPYRWAIERGSVDGARFGRRAARRPSGSSGHPPIRRPTPDRYPGRHIPACSGGPHMAIGRPSPLRAAVNWVRPPPV